MYKMLILFVVLNIIYGKINKNDMINFVTELEISNRWKKIKLLQKKSLNKRDYSHNIEKGMKYSFMPFFCA